jgi:Kef-type K+ transport system membrane component KefB
MFKSTAFTLLLMSFMMAALPASAYVGPGAGLGAIGTIIAVIGAIFLLIVGFIWYPIKRLLRKTASKNDEAKAESDNK